MAMITVICPECHEILSVPAQFAGRSGRCRKCGGQISVPAEAAARALPENQAIPHAPAPRSRTTSRPATTVKSDRSGALMMTYIVGIVLLLGFAIFFFVRVILPKTETTSRAFSLSLPMVLLGCALLGAVLLNRMLKQRMRISEFGDMSETWLIWGDATSLECPHCGAPAKSGHLPAGEHASTYTCPACHAVYAVRRKKDGTLFEWSPRRSSGIASLGISASPSPAPQTATEPILRAATTSLTASQTPSREQLIDEAVTLALALGQRSGATQAAQASAGMSPACRQALRQLMDKYGLSMETCAELFVEMKRRLS